MDKKKVGKTIAVAVAVIAVVVVFVFPSFSFSIVTQLFDKEDEIIIMKIGDLEFVDTELGEGEEIKVGDTAVVHYRGTLEDGTEFDSSYGRGEPFSFKIGAGGVIEGWERGVPGMKVGGKRTLTIPHTMAYGELGIPGVIPPAATLIFDIELVEIQ